METHTARHADRQIDKEKYRLSHRHPDKIGFLNIRLKSNKDGDIHRPTHRQTDLQAHTQSNIRLKSIKDRDSHGQKDKQTDRLTDRHPRKIGFLRH